jgi:hypothetical protein
MISCRTVHFSLAASDTFENVKNAHGNDTNIGSSVISSRPCPTKQLYNGFFASYSLWISRCKVTASGTASSITAWIL